MTLRLMTSLKKRWRILRDPEFRHFRALIRQFNREQGRGTPVKFDNVNASSIVFDLGGYEGEWCPSSYKMGHQSGLSFGGSGSFV